MARTYGMTTDCAGCRFWSEMIAMASGGGPVKAMCLSDGPLHGKYTHGKQSCESWLSGFLGAIDEPGEEDMVQMYAEEEAARAAEPIEKGNG